MVWLFPLLSSISVWIWQWRIHDLSHSQLWVLFWLTVLSFSIFGCKEYNQSDFSIDHLVMSMCRVFSCVVGRGCLLWPVHFLGKTVLVFALLHSAFQGQICLLFQVSLGFLLLDSSPLWWKGYFFGVLVLKGLVGLHRTIQLLQRYWLGHRLGSLWYWMVCLGNEQRSFYRFWDCIQVLHCRKAETLLCQQRSV